MGIEEVLNSMTSDIYQSMRCSLELGKWPNGRLITPEQKEITLQALIIYEHKNMPESERIGFIEQKCNRKSSSEDDYIAKSILRFNT